MKNSVKVGDLDYEAEVLTSISEPGAITFANYAIRNFMDSKWNYSEEKKEYQLSTLKEQREFGIFDRSITHLKAVLAADKNSCFETVAELWALSRSDPASFEKVYQVAIQANPTLEPKPVEAPGEDQPNPLV
ncbi:MAG: hypothetical protein H0X33_13220 [Taibaiella sp.]|nr:hypothetical protein [Taibaiella sp.]